MVTRLSQATFALLSRATAPPLGWIAQGIGLNFGQGETDRSQLGKASSVQVASTCHDGLLQVA